MSKFAVCAKGRSHVFSGVGGGKLEKLTMKTVVEILWEDEHGMSGSVEKKYVGMCSVNETTQGSHLLVHMRCPDVLLASIVRKNSVVQAKPQDVCSYRAHRRTPA